MIIAIDGTAGSGKSTTAKELAKRLSFFHIDSGSLYRVVTYFCILNKINSKEDELLEIALNDISIELDSKNILLNSKDVSSEIRAHNVSSSVSEYSANIIIRNKLSHLQRELAKGKDVVVEGRDIATNVFPEADFKFYLSATAEVRADRRYSQMLKTDNEIDISKDQVLKNLIKRDQLDMNREHSPLIKSDDAIEIDTTDLNIDEQVELIIKTINKE
jgi:cytidylate kinase